MSKRNQKKRDRLQQIKTEYGLTEIGANYYDPGGQANLVQSVTHQAMINSMSKGDTVNSLNVLQLGARIQESLITDQFTDDDREYLMLLRDEMDSLDTNDMSQRFRKGFEIYDFVILGLNRSLKQFTFDAPENNHKGILSDLVSNRISTRNQNWIMGIHGGVGSGKTRAAGRVGYNINKKVEILLDKKIGFSGLDWVYTKQEYLDRLKQRQVDGTLKGSVQVLEEAGDMLNSQRFWDEDVVGAVNILRQGRYQNTCLIIISQLHKDIVNKARGLMHCVMVPWKDVNKRSMEIDEVTNINFEQGTSEWKIDTLDVNPMDGGTYPQGIKVALGKVKKLVVLKPPTKLDKQIDKTDIKHKEQKMDDEYYKAIKAALMEGHRPTIIKCAKEILAEKERYYNPKSNTWKTSKIGNRWGLGGRLSEKVRDMCIEIIEKGDLKR